MPDPRFRCTSCGIPLSRENDVRFICPNCNKVQLGRCGNCRNQSAIYICPGCGFEGP